MLTDCVQTHEVGIQPQRTPSFLWGRDPMARRPGWVKRLDIIKAFINAVFKTL